MVTEIIARLRRVVTGEYDRDDVASDIHRLRIVNAIAEEVGVLNIDNDRQISAGFVFDGALWERNDDEIKKEGRWFASSPFSIGLKACPVESADQSQPVRVLREDPATDLTECRLCWPSRQGFAVRTTEALQPN